MKISLRDFAIFWGRVKHINGDLYHHPNRRNANWEEYYHYFTISWIDKKYATWGYEELWHDGQLNKAYNFGRIAFQWA